MLTRLAHATTELATLLRRCWRASLQPEQQQSLAVQLLDAVHSMLLLLGEMQQRGGIHMLAAGGSGEEPPIPVPAHEYWCAHRALTDEVFELEKAHATLTTQHANVRHALADQERNERVLRQEAARDEAEITQLKGALAHGQGSWTAMEPYGGSMMSTPLSPM